MGIKEVLFSLLGGVFQGVGISIVIKNQIEGMKRRDFIILSTLLSIFSILSILFISNEFRFISFIITLIAILYIVIGIKDRRCVLYSFIAGVVVVVSELVVTVLMIVFGINSELIIKNIFYGLLTNLFTATVMVGISYIPIIKKIFKKIIKLFEKNKRISKYFYLLLLVFYLLLLKNGFELTLDTNYYINIFFMIVLIVIVLIIVRNETKNIYLKEQYKQMLSYVTKYEKIITEQGKTNHEFKNQLMVIKGYVQTDDKEKIITYLDSIINDSKKTQNSYLIKELNKFPDGGIKGLLYYKLSMMEDEKIKYVMNVENGVKAKLKGLEVEEYKNITKILGVLLDNAIESSKKSKNKNIVIMVEKEKEKVIFSISNTYKGKIKIEKIGTGYTSKGEKHGYGLKLVKDITESNKKYEVNNYLENEYFVSKLIVDFSKKKAKRS